MGLRGTARWLLADRSVGGCVCVCVGGYVCLCTCRPCVNQAYLTPEIELSVGPCIGLDHLSNVPL